ncbi:MAG: DUF1508 domain-containing protein [Betaproteobacteria bacterium]|nr:DUF1508 domain-containing protein [Betaproteobacteria bacterium]
MNYIWRFYMDQDRRWRWQRLSADRVLVAESRTAYKEYEGCLANAQVEGYVFHPSQPKLIQGQSR